MSYYPPHQNGHPNEAKEVHHPAYMYNNNNNTTQHLMMYQNQVIDNFNQQQWQHSQAYAASQPNLALHGYPTPSATNISMPPPSTTSSTSITKSASPARVNSGDTEIEKIIETVQNNSNVILSQYLPCTDFLVVCQQELRTGLDISMRGFNASKRSNYARTQHAFQFYSTYVQPLPGNFLGRFLNRMPAKELNQATHDLYALAEQAKQQTSVSCEAVKNMFLGGMKEGESWGLRKWMSKHGGALHACNELEDVLQKVQKMDR